MTTNKIKATVMHNSTTVQTQEFKFDTIRQASYWVTINVRTFKNLTLAQAYADRMNKA
jgi:hypothetical protein